MLSRYLRQILPPFFVGQKVQISSKILPQIPNFADFVNFRQKSILSSRKYPFLTKFNEIGDMRDFVTTASLSSFRQSFVKNPNYDYALTWLYWWRRSVCGEVCAARERRTSDPRPTERSAARWKPVQCPRRQTGRGPGQGRRLRRRTVQGTNLCVLYIYNFIRQQ